MPSKAQAMAVQLCETAGIALSGKELLALPIERILQAQTQLTGAVAKFAEVPIAFMPVASGCVPVNPGAAAPERFGGKPVFIGWTRDESGSFFASSPALLDATKEQALQKFKDEFGDDGKTRYESVAEGRFERKPYAALVELSSEKLIVGPTRRFAKRMADAGSGVFAYRFDFPSPQPNVGACHCLELPFFFGNFENWIDAPMLEGLDEPRSRALSDQIQSYFLNFVESRNPNGAGLPSWTAFYGDDGELMLFD
jgi:para-nitrobenzyl esterase